jgi:hypothetical protein
MIMGYKLIIIMKTSSSIKFLVSVLILLLVAVIAVYFYVRNQIPLTVQPTSSTITKLEGAPDERVATVLMRLRTADERPLSFDEKTVLINEFTGPNRHMYKLSNAQRTQINSALTGTR